LYSLIYKSETFSDQYHKSKSASRDLQHSLQEKAEKVKDAAKEGTDLVKEKARTIYVAYQRK